MSEAGEDLYSICTAQLGGIATVDDKLQCFAQNIMTQQQQQQQQQSSQPQGDNSWLFARDFLLLYAAALVFLMQAGFAMLCAGCVRKKNVSNTMLKNLLDACGSSLAFYCLGYALAFGDDDPTLDEKTFMGTSNFFLRGVDDYAYWIFQYTFSAASATIIAGTLAERCQMGAYLGYSILLSGFVYPVVAHSVWSPHGFLSAFAVDPLWGVGMIDFAGSGVVHLTGGIVALCATSILGPRRGRFHDPETKEKLEKPKDFPGHSIALQMLGTFILWFGWFGFNAGPALLAADITDAGRVASLAGVNTSLSGGTAGIVALLANLIYIERTEGEAIFDLKYAMNGCLAGLAAISAGCGVMEPWAAVITGGMAGLLYTAASRALIICLIDDAVDAIPVHCVGGITGILSVGCFASPNKLILTYGHSMHPGFVYGDGGTLLGAQLVGLLFIISWSSVIMFPFFYLLNLFGFFRSDPMSEIVGLDLSYHGGNTYLTQLLKQGENPDDNPDSEELTAYEEQKKMKKSRHSRFSNHSNSSQIYIPEEQDDETNDHEEKDVTSNTREIDSDNTSPSTAGVGVGVKAV